MTNKTGLPSKIWLYTKFQLITKSVPALIVFPIYTLLLDALMRSSGKENISSGDYVEFLFSYQGVLMLIITGILLSILVSLDINTCIIGSALIKENKMRASSRLVFVHGIKTARLFLRPSGLFILLYVATVIPLVGIGLTISATKDFQIPNFITDVIFNNTLYTTLYIIAMAVLTLLSLRYIFTFHYIILFKKNTWEALKSARQFMKRHRKKFIRDFVLYFFIFAVVASLISFLVFTLIFLSDEWLSDMTFWKRTVSSFFLILFAEILAYLTLLTVPLLTSRLTELFYRYHEQEGISIHFSETFDTPKKTYGKGKRRLAASIALTVFVLLVTVFNALASLLIGLFFDKMFMQHADKDIIAHRGGGDLGAENTIAGLDAAIAAGAHGSEIDVQRSKNGIYIIHHDTTFSRLSGVSKKASEMNLDEIRALEVKDLFDTGRPSQKVATLEECLDHAKGRIKLYIELKGETADTAMVDDVVKMIKEKDMVAETAILSLDYALIVYTENRYPEITTGYLYFFSFGNLKTLVADILIMEEREATDKNLDIIHDAGKKAVVWTVNKRESISRFLRSDVDGIITDYVLKVKDGLTERDNRTDIEVLMDAIFD